MMRLRGDDGDERHRTTGVKSTFRTNVKSVVFETCDYTWRSIDSVRQKLVSLFLTIGSNDGSQR